MTETLPFEFPETSQPVRTAVIDGEPMLCHVDICKLLQHSNPSVAIRLVDEEDRRLVDLSESDIDALNRGVPGNGRTWFVNEAGFYCLAFASQAPGAKALRRWVAHEVLPSIRRTGSYSVAGSPSVQVQVAVNALAEVAHNEHVVPAAARILAFKRWRKPRKGIETGVQLAIDLNLLGMAAAAVEVRALPGRDAAR